jgi:hypothetical protein
MKINNHFFDIKNFLVNLCKGVKVYRLNENMPLQRKNMCESGTNVRVRSSFIALSPPLPTFTPLHLNKKENVKVLRLKHKIPSKYKHLYRYTILCKGEGIFTILILFFRDFLRDLYTFTPLHGNIGIFFTDKTKEKNDGII